MTRSRCLVSPLTHLTAALALAALALPAPVAGQEIEGLGRLDAGRPPIVDAIGENRVVEMRGVHDPNGKMVFFNEALAREMGIELPRSGMTPEIERQLVERLSWRLPRPGEDISGRRTVPMYADKYGGWGMGYNKGAGRAAFFGEHNINIKGVGATPLVSERTHESHRHGGAPMKEGFLEAVWGEVGKNLFSTGSTRILAVIDVADHTTWSDGGKERRALILRAGDQLRPAHLLAEGMSYEDNLKALERMLDRSGDLVRRTGPSGAEVIDTKATLERLADKHARTAAEMVRHRILHGGLSPGNKSLNGGMLDLGTITSQPRTAPVHVLDYTEPGSREVRSDLRFGTENEWRERDLRAVQDIFRRARGREGYAVETFDVLPSYREALTRHTELERLGASGLKPEVAEALRSADAELVRRYNASLTRLSGLTNNVEMNIERSNVERGSVADIHRALGELPATSFNASLSESQRAERAVAALALQGETEALNNQAKAEAAKLAELHRQILEKAWEHGQRFYEDRASFERQVRERAAFENRPLESLYRKGLNERLSTLISEYEKSGDASRLRAEVDKLVNESLRDVDRIMSQGRNRILAGGELLTGERLVGGLSYGVREGAAGERFVRIEMPLSEAEGRYGFRGEVLSAEEARSLSWRGTFDGWKSQVEARGTLGVGVDGKPAVIFEAPIEGGRIAAVEGLMRTEGGRWIKANGENFRGYTAAVPDKVDAERLRLELRAGFEGLDSRYARYDVGRDATAREVERFAEKVRRLGGVVERLPSTDPRLPGQGRTFIDPDGRIRVLLPSDRPVKFVALVDELVHARQFRSMADAKGIEAVRELLSKAAAGEPAARAEVLRFELEAKEKVRLVTPRADPARATVEAEITELERALQSLDRFRRADGTLRWKEVLREQALQQGAGVAHFALALFLKELAVVVQTGDTLRIEEFFDGLMTTDFFVHYGLFAAGAQASSVAYSRFLERHIRPTFVSGLLKQNIVLATGMALPELIHGRFDGEAFAINLASLGLASAAVQGGMAAIRWVVDLRKAEATGRLAGAAARLRRFARVGGWFYTAAETAVVLYVGEALAEAYRDWQSERAARDEVGAQTIAMLQAAASGAGFEEALAAFEASHEGFRNYLYHDIAAAEAVYQDRLGKAATSAKRIADKRAGYEERFAKYEALAAAAVRQYGSLEAAIDALVKPDEDAIAEDVRLAMEALERSRAATFAEVYGGARRRDPYLEVDDLDWVLRGAQPGASGDPYKGRTDILARWGRGRLTDDAASAAGAVSGNRLQAYEDELEALRVARRLAGRDAARLDLIDAAIARAEIMLSKDRELAQSSMTSDGATGALRGMGR